MIPTRQALANLLAQRQDLTVAEAAGVIANLGIVLELARLDPEDWFLAGILPWWGVITQAGNAAENTTCQVFNGSTGIRPALVVVEKISAIGGAAGVAEMGLATGPLSTGGNVGFRDSQVNPATPSGFINEITMRSQTAVILASAFTPWYSFNVPLTPASATQEPRAVLAPQTGLNVRHQTVNVALTLSASGYKLDLRVRT